MKMKKEADSLGARIRQIRGKMTQSEFADILRIKQAMISRYEANKETPSPRILLRVARFSGKSIEWLLTGADNLATVEPMKVRRIGAKTSQDLTLDDLLDLAADYLRDTKNPMADKFTDIMRDVFKYPDHMKDLLEYFRYLRFKDATTEPGK